MIFYILISILIVVLFLYSKLTPYKANLTGQYKSVFQFCEQIFQPILNFLRKIVKPAQVGNSIAVDMSQIILLVLLLMILRLL
jgi:uncharacterized protein YggT (Ycf19 family)